MGALKGFFASSYKKDEQRPRLDIPRSPLEMVLDALTLLGLFALIFIIAYYWGRLPDVIPTHFDINGQPNDWGSPGYILIMALVGASTAIGLYVLTFFPHIYNYPVKITAANAAAQYRLGRTLLRYINAAILLLFSYLEWKMCRDALQAQSTGTGGFMIEMVIYNAIFLVPLIYYFIAASRRR